MKKNLFRKLLCKLRVCPFKQKEDDISCWAECVLCGEGKERTFVDRRILSSYSELCYMHDKHRNLVAILDQEETIGRKI